MEAVEIAADRRAVARAAATRVADRQAAGNAEEIQAVDRAETLRNRVVASRRGATTANVLLCVSRHAPHTVRRLRGEPPALHEKRKW